MNARETCVFDDICCITKYTPTTSCISAATFTIAVGSKPSSDGVINVTWVTTISLSLSLFRVLGQIHRHSDLVARFVHFHASQLISFSIVK